MRFINGTRLDDRIIRTDWDAGFREGRQYGRGSLEARWGTPYTHTHTHTHTDQALTIARLTRSPRTTKISRIRCYINKYYNLVCHTISVYI